jgi:hypothetical protein
VRVDAEDSGVSRASHERRVRGSQVVDVAALPVKATILAAFDGKADGRAHEIVVKVVAV